MGAAARPGGNIDLPADMQRELEELESKGDRLTHYELLSVAADADGGTIRRAYLEKSKRFHPDACSNTSQHLFVEIDRGQELQQRQQLGCHEPARAARTTGLIVPHHAAPPFHDPFLINSGV